MELLNIEEGACSENQSSEVGSSQGQSELFLCKDWMEVVWIDASVVLIPLFGVDVPVSSEGIRLSSEASRVETNDKVELREEL